MRSVTFYVLRSQLHALIALLEFLQEADTLGPSERVQFHYV